MDNNNSLISEFRKLEELHLKPEIRASVEQMADLLVDDFVEFGSSGRIYTKSQVLKAMPLSIVRGLLQLHRAKLHTALCAEQSGTR